MRVDLYNSTAATEALAHANKVTNDKAASAQTKQNAHKAETEDKTTLTSGSETVKSLAKTALQTTPSQTAKVEALKQAVSAASYQLDSAKIAEALANADV